MKYIVYLTKNLKSKVGELNKIYIGVHQTNDPNTFDGYLGCGVYIDQPSTYMYPKTPFQYAVKKYGTKAFERTTLYIYDTLEEAYNKESELINAEYLKADYTYNYLNTNSYKTIYQFNTSGELQKKWEYSLEAYDFYGQSPKKFQYAIDRKYEFLNSYWALEPEIDVIKYCKKYYPELSDRAIIQTLYKDMSEMYHTLKTTYDEKGIDYNIIVSNITNRVADKEYIIITFEVVGVLTQGEKCIHDNPETNIGVSHNKGKNWTFLALTDDVPNILRMRFDEEIINKIMNY